MSCWDSYDVSHSAAKPFSTGCVHILVTCAEAVGCDRQQLDEALELAPIAHGGGPPTCWCRPPLPGLPLAFARSHGIDPARSILVGTSPAHRTLATTLGARYLAV